MICRFTSRTFVLLPLFSLLFIMFVSHESRAQESQSAPKSAAGTASVAQAAPKTSNPDENRSSKIGNKESALLTHEYTAVKWELPSVVEKVEVPNTSFIREWYRAEWRAGDPFYFFVIRPKGVAKSPVILYLPSFPDDTELFQNNNWCDLAVRGGYAVVGFVGNLTGHRTRYRPLKDWFVSQMPEALTTTTHDVQMILDYASTRGDLDMDHVAMFGSGSGASIAILASVVDPRIKVLDLLAPWGDWKVWLNESKVVPDDERASYSKPEFLATVSPLDPITWLPKVQARSIRIEDIRGNKAMPDKSQEKLESAAPNFALINQYGNGRAFLATQPPISVLDWVKSQLAPDAKPQIVVEKSARIHFFPAIHLPAPSNLPNLPVPQPTKGPTVGKENVKEKESPR